MNKAKFRVNDRGFVIVNVAGELVKIDQNSGGYPYWVDWWMAPQIWLNKSAAQDYFNSFKHYDSFKDATLATFTFKVEAI